LFICLFFTGTVATAQTKNTGTSASDLKSQTAGQNNGVYETNFWDVIQTRRSVRKYKSVTVPDTDIRKIIDAARMAPTSGNQQPWKFLVITDKVLINNMMEACIKLSVSRYNANSSGSETMEQYESKVRQTLSSGYFSAPVFIVILTDNNSKYPDYNHWDGPLAAGYLMLAAKALGYGTVFITDAIPDNVTKEVLQIPDNYTRVCITPLGVPVEWPATPPKKDLNEMISFDKF
jgi:nitroreductase